MNTDSSVITVTETNHEAVEVWLGEAFETHLPSRGLIEFRGCHGSVVHTANGDTLRRCVDGVHQIVDHGSNQ